MSESKGCKSLYIKCLSNRKISALGMSCSDELINCLNGGIKNDYVPHQGSRVNTGDGSTGPGIFMEGAVINAKNIEISGPTSMKNVHLDKGSDIFKLSPKYPFSCEDSKIKAREIYLPPKSMCNIAESCHLIGDVHFADEGNAGEL